MDFPLGPRYICNVLTWDLYGPSCTRGDFFDLGLGPMAALRKAVCMCVHVIVPFIGRKNGTLMAWQPSYNDVHGWYRARMEHLFGQLWHWGLVRSMWHYGPYELHQSVRVLFLFGEFCIRRQVRRPPYGPWDHVPPHVWTDKSNSVATQDEAEDEATVCGLCCQKRCTITVCGECKEHYCAECIDPHTCGYDTVC
jgi:hypothetical protein